MKRLLSIALSICLTMSLGACGGTVPEDTAPTPEPVELASDVTPSGAPEPEPEASGPNTLVVFFSRQNNALPGVEAVASASLSTHDVTVLSEFIVEAVDEADLFQIVTAEPYPGDYTESTQVATAELEAGARPQLATHVDHMDRYDVIYLGYPIWWGTIPMAVASFLEEYDLTGKTIVPFCTHEGSGMGSSVADVVNSAPGAIVVENGFAVRGNQAGEARGDIGAWIDGLDLD